jgi:hypothetical protein
MSTFAALAGAQLSIEISADNATVRGGTAKPDTEAA